LLTPEEQAGAPAKHQAEYGESIELLLLDEARDLIMSGFYN